MTTLLVALGIVFVIEGLLPFAAPAAYQRLVQHISAWAPGQIRFYGLVSIAIGVVMLWVAG